VLTAAGEKLAIPQEAIQFNRHAIQCRINAEDPTNNFAPSFGRVEYLRYGVGPFVRNDSGIYQGWEVPSVYDSLLMKICTIGNDRNSAIERMQRALSEFEIRGVKTTVPMHKQILQHPEFVDGSYTTDFMPKHMEEVIQYDDEEGMRDISRIAALVAEISALGQNPYCR